MKNYENMSDFEINAMVSKILFGSSMVDFDCNPFPENCSGFSYETERGFYSFNGCNNPSDAWPIIFENEISLVVVEEGVWVARFGSVFYESSNPLHAAMMVYLKMKDEDR